MEYFLKVYSRFTVSDCHCKITEYIRNPSTEGKQSGIAWIKKLTRIKTILLCKVKKNHSNILKPTAFKKSHKGRKIFAEVKNYHYSAFIRAEA